LLKNGDQGRVVSSGKSSISNAELGQLSGGVSDKGVSIGTSSCDEITVAEEEDPGSVEGEFSCK
jgi:hypothetical protein